MLNYLLQSFSGPAGPFMYALLALLAFALAVVIERAITLTRARCDGEALLARLAPAIRSGEALQLGDTPMERVAAAGLDNRDPEVAWDAMAARAVQADLAIRRRIPYLATVASISTMVGLVGTVYGLILAFGAVGEVSGAERAARLSEGSATAMATTAFGLLVAIPAMVAHSVAEAGARELLGQIEHTANRLMVMLREARR